MSNIAPRSPKRFSHKGFQQLRDHSANMAPNDATIDIPLEQVETHASSGKRNNGGPPPHTNEKTVNFSGGHGRRKMRTHGEPLGHTGYDGEEDTINRMGKIYYKVLHFSIITRYFIYVSPLALAIAIPIIVGATVAQDAKIGGVRIVWFFTWIEIVWLSVWGSKIVAHFLPVVFQVLAGVVSSGVRKYSLVIKALEIPLSLVGWAVCSLATFIPLMLHNPDIRRETAAERAQNAKNGDASKATTVDKIQTWESIVRQLLAAALASACVLLVEKLLIQLISINYHRKQFNAKIKESKRHVYLLGLLYDASRALFPAYCPEFEEEDYVITDMLRLNIGGKKGGHLRSGSATPMRLLQDVGRIGDKITSAFGNVASEITGKQVFNPDSAHSIVVQALERNRSSEALAKRLWMSFVVEGKLALYLEDIVEVLGPGRETEAEECFMALDKDGNGDISLDEMILTVTEIGRTRKSVATSMHDVDQAINVLDGLLGTVVFVICVFVFIAFLNSSFVTTLATAGTALLSLSFVFSVTCQEVLGSCIFLFVKHPYDVGDRIDLSDDQLIVEHISLLFTVFRRVNNGRMVQIPNIVLNTLWVENVSRSNAMREQVSIYVSFATTFEDIKTLQCEMQSFVRDKDNCRDFQPDVDVDVRDIAEMNKLELCIEIRHKSNWANETVRATRRSKFMCALVLALRKVPIDPPGGSDDALGGAGKPSYSVAISASEAQERREQFLSDKEAKRLYPTKKDSSANKEADSARSTGIDYLSTSPNPEAAAISQLNSRNPAVDMARDDAFNGRDDASTLGDQRSILDPSDAEQVRGMLKRESTKGKRKPSSMPPVSPSVPTISEPGFSVGAGVGGGGMQQQQEAQYYDYSTLQRQESISLPNSEYQNMVSPILSQQTAYQSQYAPPPLRQAQQQGQQPARKPSYPYGGQQ